MKLIKTDLTQLQRIKDCGILKFSALYDLAKEGTDIKVQGTLDYKGPKIPRNVWNQALSFLKWVYDESKSEAQLRFYCNPKTDTWAAWAYPQEANGGLSANEIDNEASKIQRAQFKDSDGWIYLMTLHSHCDISAFQSGVDEANEKNQDGLHITIGHLNQPKYDMHCRFYFGKDLFEPDMSIFWEIGDVFGSLDPALKSILPIGAEDKLARAQMVQPVTVDFPQQWKDNVIEKPKVITYGDQYSREYGNGTLYVNGSPHVWSHVHNKMVPAEWDNRLQRMVPILPVIDSTPGKSLEENKQDIGPIWRRRGKGKKDEKLEPVDVRKKKALEEVVAMCVHLDLEPIEVYKDIEYLNGEPSLCAIVQALKDHNLIPQDLWDEASFEYQMLQHELDLDADKAKQDEALEKAEQEQLGSDT